jgi:hypothetical protein
MRKLRKTGRHSHQLESIVDAKEVLSAVVVALALLERSEPFLDRP